jgi:hypothetical protein
MEFTDSDMVVPSEIVLRIAEYVVWSGERVSGFGLSCKAAAAATTEAVAARTQACTRFWDAAARQILIHTKLCMEFHGVDVPYLMKHSDHLKYDGLVKEGLHNLKWRLTPLYGSQIRLSAAKNALARVGPLRVCFAKLGTWVMLVTRADLYEDLRIKYECAGPLFVPGSASALEMLYSVTRPRDATPQPDAKRARLN